MQTCILVAKRILSETTNTLNNVRTVRHKFVENKVRGQGQGQGQPVDACCC